MAWLLHACGSGQHLRILLAVLEALVNSHHQAQAEQYREYLPLVHRLAWLATGCSSGVAH